MEDEERISKRYPTYRDGEPIAKCDRCGLWHPKWAVRVVRVERLGTTEQWCARCIFRHDPSRPSIWQRHQRNK